ncbi:MAG: hypothetical protein LBV07_02650 [Syntrophobacterales bacterium]|jgi:hypothetical protein|nr:hypothetical protein [Syntrophobacterales bacterium]
MKKGVRITALFLLPSLILIFPAVSLGADSIKNYQVVFRPFTTGAQTFIAIRTFERNGSPKLLAVHTDTLETAELDAKQRFLPSGDGTWKNSPFCKLLPQGTSSSCPRQNDGLSQAGHGASGSYLTVDMCPSRKPFEKRFFEKLAELSKKRKDAVPVAIAITGAWLLKHEQDFSYILDLINKNKIQVTWVNHSFHHSYRPGKDLDENFLLLPGTNFDAEVMKTEILLLERNLLPSVFFRFPGLVSDCDLISRLRHFSLIPVGSRAWLAKGETVKEGSIILLHGNGNEPAGISLFLKLFQSREDEFLRGKFRLRPLGEAFLES